MSTRGAWGFRKNGTDKITYNHFDSYPTGLGKVIQDFILKSSIEELNEIYDKIILQDSSIKPTEKQIEECKKYANLEVSSQKITDWYCLLREAQGNPFVYKDDCKYMLNGREFMYDGLFCEWAYIINLDQNTLIIYEGFSQKIEPNRYYNKDYEYHLHLREEVPLDQLHKFDMEKLEEEDVA